MITKIDKEDLKNLLEELESHINIEYEDDIFENAKKLFGENVFLIKCFYNNEYDDSNYAYSIYQIELYDKNNKLIKKEDRSIYNELIDGFISELNEISPWTKYNSDKEYKIAYDILYMYFGEPTKLKEPTFYIDYEHNDR